MLGNVIVSTWYVQSSNCVLVPFGFETQIEYRNDSYEIIDLLVKLRIQKKENNNNNNATYLREFLLRIDKDLFSLLVQRTD